MKHQPDGKNLLLTGRDVLLQALLPALPPELGYDARMVANAMAIAARELDLGAALAQAQRDAIAAFYQGSGMACELPDEPTLALDIRAGRFVPAQEAALLALLEVLTREKLRISNPKRL